MSALNLADAASAVSPFPRRAHQHSDPVAIDDLNGDGVPELAEVDYGYIETRDGNSLVGGPTTVRLTIAYSPFLSGAAPHRAGFTAYVAQTANRRAFGDVHLVRDVSGDRIPDIVVTDTLLPRAGRDRGSGTAWVIFGRTDGSTVNTGRTPGWGYTVAGAGRGASFGDSVDGGQDVSGDGVGDLVISAAEGYYDGNRRSVYVVFGKPNAADVNVSTRGPWGYRIARVASRSLGTSEDVNGDGRAEVLVGRHLPDGQATLVLPGKESPGPQHASEALLTLTGETGYLTDSGDLNGDGRTDLVLVNPYHGSSPTATPSRTSPVARPALLVPPPNPGAVFVVFGTPASPRTVDLQNMSADEGYVIRGANSPDRLDSASIAGDFNGDAHPDLVINAPGARRYCADGAGAYVVFSRPTGKSVWLGDPRENALRLDASRNEFRTVELPAGDINQDGQDDLLLYTEQGRSSARLYTVLGRSDLPVSSDRTPPRAKIVIERNRAMTFKSLLAKRFIRVDLTLSEPARVGLVVALSTPKRNYPRFVTRKASVNAGRTEIRIPLDRRARRKLRAGASDISGARRERTKLYERNQRAEGGAAFVYGPVIEPHGILYARARLNDGAGNRCHARSGLFGSIYVR